MNATVIKRHTLATRIMHWVNALCVFLVLMSGLQIFNAHPHLYWGQHGSSPDPVLFEIKPDESGRAFPSWSTIPSWRDLAGGRRWHFFFAWILVVNSALFLLISLARRHVQRDLLPRKAELSVRHIAADLWNHARLRFPTGEAARHYNILQKLSYSIVILVLAPLMLATGLTMSPGGVAAFPWLLDLFGGRQSARTLHFVVAMLIATFIVVHLLMVLLAGPWNEIRSMVTGRYVLPRAKGE